MTGRIIKGVGSFYTVMHDSNLYVLRAPGRFRRENMTPLVGDMVDFTPPEGEADGFIESIHPRKNMCQRPAVANIDQLAIVVAPLPEPDMLLVDRLMIHALMEGLNVLFCLNKSDMESPLYDELARDYQKTGADICIVSAREGTGIETLKEKLSGYTTCFAGQSGTGKSSLLNAVLPDLSLPTGKISQRTARGKHTTRHASLIEIETSGYVVDTPGFSLLELPPIDPIELKEYYPEFAPYEGNCRYNVCAHLKEPDCAVIEAANDGSISKNRLMRYGQLYDELYEKWKNKYN